MGLLVGDDLLLPREGHVKEEVVQAAERAAQARLLQPWGVKAVAGGHRGQEPAKLLQLVRGDRFAAGKSCGHHACVGAGLTCRAAAAALCGAEAGL